MVRRTAMGERGRRGWGEARSRQHDERSATSPDHVFPAPRTVNNANQLANTRRCVNTIDD